MSAADTTTDPATTPGGLEERKARTIEAGPLAGGTIEFESAPVGYLTKAGTPRKTPWRAYFWSPQDGDRQRMTSVTTLLGPIMDKPGLPPWAEAKGIEGAQAAMRRGILTGDTPDPVGVVRRARLGADASRDEAATRGVNVHALLEEYARTGSPPVLGDWPPELHGYIRALVGWLLKNDPEPVLIEELVCDPSAGYAGRMDLLANIGGFLTAVDFKTSARAAIYEGAHVQTKLYSRAHVRCGGEEPLSARIVVMAEDGGFAEMECAADDALVDWTLGYARALAPVRNACARHNAAEKKARAAA